MNITVIGGGSWGSALARILGDNKNDVLIYETSSSIVDEINNEHTNKNKLPIGSLPLNVSATNDLKEAVSYSDILVIAVPTKVIRLVIKQINTLLDRPTIFVNASKGLEPETYNRVSEIVSQEIDPKYLRSFVALTGPSHAEEVIRQMLTAVCAVSDSVEDAKLIQNLFNNHTYFRVYTGDDLKGSELCSALKNIYAIASGMLEGIGLGDNARAALISRTLVELKRLLIAFGANVDTLYGLTGVGDLIVTCTSHHSRNFQAGVSLATGNNLKETISSMSMVVEGARTCISAYQFAREHNLDTPILDAVYDVIYNEQDVKTALENLMQRTLKKDV